MIERQMTEAELVRWGRETGRHLPPGSVVWLVGDLGAGKTTLARALLEGLGVGSWEEEGTGWGASPTYTLVHRYPGSGGGAPVYHLDCYRLRDPEEASELEWEAMAQARVVLVEWPERGAGWVPAPTHTIHLSHVADPDRRDVEVTP